MGSLGERIKNMAPKKEKKTEQQTLYPQTSLQKAMHNKKERRYCFVYTLDKADSTVALTNVLRILEKLYVSVLTDSVFLTHKKLLTS